MSLHSHRTSTQKRHRASSAAAKQHSKRLKRLRYYCQLCEKQCNDENGFRNHCQSNAHLQHVASYAQSRSATSDHYNREFLQSFLAQLSRQGVRLVPANKVYQDMIADRTHVHMNATKWHTLTDLVRTLQDEQLADVKQDAQGQWMVRHRPTEQHSSNTSTFSLRNGTVRDVATIFQDDERRRLQRIDRAAQAAAMMDHSSDSIMFNDSSRSTSDNVDLETNPLSLPGDPISHTLNVPVKYPDSMRSSPPPASETVRSVFQLADSITHGIDVNKNEHLDSTFNRCDMLSLQHNDALYQTNKRKRSELELIAIEESRANLLSLKVHQKQLGRHSEGAEEALHALSPEVKIESEDVSANEVANQDSDGDLDVLEPWLFVGLIVRVMDQTLDARYLRSKGQVTRLIDDWRCEIIMLCPTLSAVYIDCRLLETVIPALNSCVRVVAGPRKGQFATLVRLSDDQRMAIIHCQDQQDISVSLTAICKTAITSTV